MYIHPDLKKKLANGLRFINVSVINIKFSINPNYLLNFMNFYEI